MEKDERSERVYDHTAVDDKPRKEVLDDKEGKGMFDRSDHDVVLTKMKIRDMWEYERKNDNGNTSEVIASEKMYWGEV